MKKSPQQKKRKWSIFRAAFSLRSIRSRILVGFIGVALIAVTGTSIGAGIVYYNLSRAQALERLSSAVSLKQAKFETWRDALQDGLLVALTSNTPASQVGIVLDLSLSNQYYDFFNESLRRQLKFYINNQARQFKSICLVDLNGKLVQCTDDEWSGYQCATESFFVQGLGSPFMQLPFQGAKQPDTATEQACWPETQAVLNNWVMVSRPVSGNDGQIHGVIVGLVDDQKLVEILLDKTGLGETGQAFLYNPDGRSLTITPNGLLNRVQAKDQGDRSALSAGVYRSADQMSTITGVFKDGNGRNVLGVYYWLPIPGVVLAVEQNVSEVIGLQWVTVWVSLGVALGTIVIAFFISVLLARSITQPLVNLVTTAKDISSGNFSSVATVLKEDEIGTLAQAFNSMTSQLRDLIGNLEQRVQVRTVALEQANQALSHRARQLETISAVSRKITSILDIDDLLLQLVLLIRDSFNCFLVRVFLLEGDELVLRATTPGKPVLQVERLPTRITSLNSEAVKQNKVIFANDISIHPYYMREAISDQIRSEMAIPLRLSERCIGTLDVVSSELNFFATEDVILFQSLGDQIAIAIENANLYQRSRELATIEERARLSRNLHDSVLQSLYSLNLITDGWRRMVQSGAMENVGNYFARAGEIARQALKEMRLLVFDLRLSPHEKKKIADALKERLATVENRAGIKSELIIEEITELPRQAEDSLYYIAMEALNNALKYSGASEIRVKLAMKDDLVWLQVQDNGKGFNKDSVECQGGMGLSNIQNRAQELDGYVDIQSIPDQGTTVNVFVMPKKSPDLSRNGANG